MRVQCENRGTRELRAVFHFDPAGVRLEETAIGVVVHLDGCVTAGEPGEPGLPKRNVRLALPPRTRLVGIDIDAGEAMLVRDTAVPVAPMQLPRPAQELRPNLEPLKIPPYVPPDPALYERAMRREPAHVLEATLEGFTSVVSLDLNPVRLMVDARLVIHPEIVVLCRLQDDDTAGGKPHNIHSYAQAQRQIALTRRTVLNKDNVFDYSNLYPLLNAETDYLIITDNKTWDAKDIKPVADAGGDLVASFERLAQWKRQRGLAARVVTITDIVDGRYGDFRTDSRDLQEVLRNFLKKVYHDWGIAWVLLGGGVSIVPVREVAGSLEGGVEVQKKNPPPKGKAVWVDDHLRMRLPNGTWSGYQGGFNNLLVNYQTGVKIPFDGGQLSSTTSAGWFFTTDNTYKTWSSSPTEFIRVNGPADEVNAYLQFLFDPNMIPTDLYYASLVSDNYDQPGKHDWDLVGNEIYGQHSGAGFDGINYWPTVSVGRAPVTKAAEADIFVDKVIRYEKYERANGDPLDADYARRVLLASQNWDGVIEIGPSPNAPPPNHSYHHAAGATHTIIRIDAMPDYTYSLVAFLSESDIRPIPRTNDAPSLGRGWYFAQSDTDLSPATITLPLLGGGFVTYPFDSQWIAVFGPAEELEPLRYIFNQPGLDGSAVDQELLREQLAQQMPGFDSFRRLYQDVPDLTPPQAGAAPLQLITEERLVEELNRGPHIVSLSGHGSSWGCCLLSIPVADGAANGDHTFIAYADSCLTNQFDVDTMSAHLLRNPNGGAVAYVGSTRYSWIGTGDDIQRRFFEEWASLAGDAHLGLLFDTRVSKIADLSWKEAARWTVLALNLMGDPEMPLWWSKAASINPPDLLVQNDLTVTLGPPDPPEWWFEAPYRENWTKTFVHLKQDGVERLAIADANGRVNIPLSEFRSGPATVTISRPGHKPIIQSVTLRARSGCLGWLLRLFR